MHPIPHRAADSTTLVLAKGTSIHPQRLQSNRVQRLPPLGYWKGLVVHPQRLHGHRIQPLQKFWRWVLELGNRQDIVIQFTMHQILKSTAALELETLSLGLGHQLWNQGRREVTVTFQHLQSHRGRVMVTF